MDEEGAHDLPVEEILSDTGTGGAQGPPSPIMFVSPTAEGVSALLSDALSIPVQARSRGRGTYLGACMGLKPSGGFSVAIAGAVLQDAQVTVGLDVQEPDPDSFAITVLTSPFAVAVIRDLDPTDKSFSVDRPDWPVVWGGC